MAPFHRGYINKGDIPPEVAADRRRAGNRVGAVLSAFGVVGIAGVGQVFSRP